MNQSHAPEPTFEDPRTTRLPARIQGRIRIEAVPGPVGWAKVSDIPGGPVSASPELDPEVDAMCLSLPESSLEEIHLVGILEKLPKVAALGLLTHVHRWLAPGGRLRLECTDGARACRMLSSASSDRPHRMAAARLLAGRQTSANDYVLDPWFPDRLRSTLLTLGWNVESMESEGPDSAPKIVASASRPASIPGDPRQNLRELLRENMVADAEKPTFDLWVEQTESILAGTSAWRNSLPTNHAPLASRSALGNDVNSLERIQHRPTGPIRLHLGCGEQYLDGYVNVDYPSSSHNVMTPRPDIEADIIALSFPEGSVQEVRSHHVFEHFPSTIGLALLCQWRNWVRPGGTLLIEVPDAEEASRTIVDSAIPWKRRMATLRCLSGDQADSWAYHVEQWFAARFERVLPALGWNVVAIKKSCWDHEPFLPNLLVQAERASCTRSAEEDRNACLAILREGISDHDPELVSEWSEQLSALLPDPPPAATPAIAPCPPTRQRNGTNEHLSFSQCGEDRIVHFIFQARGLERPSYIDIGAHHPTRLSNTALFYLNGCRGINVEPDPTLFEAFPIERPDDVNLNMGIAERSEERDFFIMNAKTLNTFSREGMEDLVSAHPHFHVERVAKIRTEPLQAIIDRHCGGRFPDFLSLDVEGLDIQILSSLRADNAPKVVCVETVGYAEDGTGRKSTEILELMARLGYMVFGDTNINTIFVRRDFWILDPARRQEEFWFRILPSSSPAKPESPASRTTAIVFSKDRAYQLDGLLRSFREQVSDWSEIDLKVIYAASTPEHERSYKDLASSFSDWRRMGLHRESDFRSDLIGLVDGSRHVLFLVDDTVFAGPTAVRQAAGLLEDRQDVIGYSFRLGRNSGRCYTLGRDQQIPPMQEVGDSVVWRWPEADADFGYPLELSSSLYRTEDILPLLRSEAYRNPNSLEDAISRNAPRFARRRPLLASLPVARAFSIPANVVQGTHANRHGTTDAQVLLDAWQRGVRMDVRSLRGTVPDAAHMELDILGAGRPAGTEPLVSVVVPCYKQSEFLPECIESVVAQTYRNIEVLIVDDGSPDDTAEVAQRLIAAHPERDIRLLRKPNGGLASARNHGIAASHGDLVLPLDNDDRIHPDMVAALVELLEAHPEISIASSDYHRFGSDSGRVQVTPVGPGILDANSMPYCSMYRRKVWETNGGYRENMRWGYEDWNFWVSSWANGFRCAKAPQALFFYRVKPQSMVLEAQSHHGELRARIVANNRDAYPEAAQAEACEILCSLTAESMVENDFPMALERMELALMALPSGQPEERRTLESSVEKLRIRVQSAQGRASSLPRDAGSGEAGMRALAEADQVFANGDPEGALQILHSLPSEQETLPIVNAKAWLLLRCDRPAEAQVEYVKATQLWPDLPEVHANLAGILLRRGMPERARAPLARVLELDPKQPEALLALARLHAGEGRIAEARILLGRLRAAAPTHPGVAELVSALATGTIEASIVIPVKDQLPLLTRCIESIESTCDSHRVEIVVVDDRSASDTSRALAAWAESGRIRLLAAPSAGNFAASCNAGASIANGRDLVFLNSDVEASPGWLRPLLDVLDETGVGAVGARLLYPDGRAQHAGIAFGPDGIPYHPNRGQDGESPLVVARKEVPGLTGACLAMRARYFSDLGGFDEAYRFQVEDLDLCLRVWSKGLRVVYEPKSRLIHHEGASSAIRPEKDRLFREGLSRLFSTWADKGGFPPAVQALPGFPAMLKSGDAPATSPTTSATSSPTGAPKVSVVLPTRDRPVFLRRALDSLMAQTFRDFEVVVVNDAGCDVSAIVAEFVDKGLLVRLRVHPGRRGLGAARNTGIRAAQAPWIAYLDDDDLYYPEHLRLILETLERTGAKVAYSDSMRAVEEEQGGQWVVLSNELAMSNDFDRDAFLRTNLTPVNNVIHARTCWEEVGGIDETLPVLEDWDFWIRLSRRWDFVHVPVATTEIRWRSNGANMTFQRQGEFQPTRDRIAEKIAAMLRNESSAQELVSIVILVRDCLEITRDCLESLERHTPEPHEVVIVDNGSGPEAAAWLRGWVSERAHATLVRNNDNRGFAGGNNQGLALARGRFLLLLNNDTVLTPGWLGRMLAVLHRHPECGAVGPVSNRISGPQLDRTATYVDADGPARHAEERAKLFSGRSEEILRAVGFCLLFRREVLDRIGGLDERFGKGNFEDDDFSLRIRHAGWKSRMALDSFVHHVGGATFRGANIDYASSLLANWAIFLRKWGLPEDLPYEGGYPFQQNPPKEALLRIGTPSPVNDHFLVDGRIHLPFEPGFGRAVIEAPSTAIVPVAPASQAAQAPSTRSVPSNETLESLNRILFRAEAATARGDLAEAEDATREAVEKHPDVHLAWLARAMILRGLGKIPQAAQSVQKSLSLDLTPEALLESVQVHRLAGRKDLAKDHETLLRKQHAPWLAATKALYAQKGQAWPLDAPAKARKKSVAPPMKRR